jgi:hypothetical protein
MARIRTAALLIASLVVALVASASRSLAQTTWTAELVDPNGAFEDAAWGPDGPAIAYVFSDSPTSPPSVKYAYRTDAWHVEEVSNSYIFSIGADPLLAFGRNGDAWILYGQAFPQGSVLMHRTAPDTWETVKFVPNASGFDLQLAPDGSLAMLLQRDPYVVYATWDGHLRTSRVARGRPGSIGFERDRAPAVAFEDSSGGISYALRFGGAWNISVVDDALNAAYDSDPSLGFVSPKEPVIGYTQVLAGGSDSNLRLADRGPDGTWRTRPVDTGRKSGLSPSLAIGGVETIYIAYFRGGFDNPDLRLATHTPTFQEATTIFSGLFISAAYGSPRLVVDPGGVPHVAFVDGAGLEFGSPST